MSHYGLTMSRQVLIIVLFWLLVFTLLGCGCVQTSLTWCCFILGCGCVQTSLTWCCFILGCGCTQAFHSLCWAVVVQFHSQQGINSRNSKVQFLWENNVTECSGMFVKCIAKRCRISSEFGHHGLWWHCSVFKGVLG